jgi:very-short-patch-repair endonuclease
MNSKIKIYLARELRKESTVSEKMFWNRLRSKKFLGLKFRRQYIIDGYIVDFYCHSLRLAVEIDGNIHLKQIDDDKFRQKIIEERGIKFFRVTAREVEDGVNNILAKLEYFIQTI